MSKYIICVYAICKNEEQFVDRWMASVGEADMVVVLDTGSTDRSVEKLRAAGAIVHQATIKPWRFDAARNLAMDKIPEGADICVSNDMDEVFVPGWRQKLEKAWSQECTQAQYLFTWDYKPDGSPNKQYTMKKIHRRHGFRWVNPVHEVLKYNGPDVEKLVCVDDLVLNHYPDKSKPRGQYLPLLELSASENPQDSSTVFWLGREYLWNNKYDLCIETLRRHLKLPSANCGIERCASMRCIAKAYAKMQDVKEAKLWLIRAITEFPFVREPFLELARIGYSEKDWSLTFEMVRMGLKITERYDNYLVESECWGYVLYDLGAISAYHLGLYKESRKYAAQALEYEPNNKRLKENLELIEKCLPH